MIEVTIRRQPAQIMEILRIKAEELVTIPKPEVPKISVETAPNEFKLVDNPDDATYIEQMEQFQLVVVREYTELLWKSIAEIGVIDVVTEADVASLRAGYSRLGIEVPEDPKLFWLKYVAAPSTDDFSLLLYEVFGKSLPKEKQVAMYKRMFQSDVPE